MKEKGTENKEVQSYLMSQPQSCEKEVWFSLACDLCTTEYSTITAHSQPVIHVQQGQNNTKSEGEKCVECLWLRVFKSLPTSHATAMCTRQYTCRGCEYWSERTGGRASRYVGGAQG